MEHFRARARAVRRGRALRWTSTIWSFASGPVGYAIDPIGVLSDEIPRRSQDPNQREPASRLPDRESRLRSRESEPPEHSTLPTNRQTTPLWQHLPPGFREGVRKGTMIAKDFIIGEDFCSYTTIILRQNKRVRDHVPLPLDQVASTGRKRRTVGMGRDQPATPTIAFGG
jgi:hypothetical protein